MAKTKRLADTEAFVRKVLTETFKQKADAETVRAVAKKVSQAVIESAPKKETVPPKKKAA
jgi:hypothetical protein